MILQTVYQSLLRIDMKTGQLIPWLAGSRPVKEVRDSITLFTYRLRSDAKWPDGSAVTASDVAFTLKAVKNPLTDCQALRGYLGYIQDMVQYKQDSLRFTLVCGPDFILGEATSGDFYILQETLYDPHKFLRTYTLTEIASIISKQAEDEPAGLFAQQFNSIDFTNTPDKLRGSGAYRLLEWRVGEIALERLPTWWGHAHTTSSHWFEAYPELLVFRVIGDYDAATYAMKTGQLDIIKGIPASKFEPIYHDSAIAASFTLRTPDILAYVYLGVNTGTPSLSTKKTRQALAYLVDKKKIIEIIHRGFASPAFSYVLPTNTTYFNPQLPAREYNPAQAIKLLTEDGWADVNNDGLLERNFKGTEQQMVLTFLYPANNEERKSIGLLLRESFAKVGIQLTLEPLDFATFNKRLRSHQFDLMVAGRTINPIADDPEPTFSTNSIQNGGNYPGFGDAETDRLIQAMRTAGEKDRIKLSKRLQWMVHEDASFIFLYHPKERILVNKKFGRVLTSPISPRIWAAGLQIGTKP